MSHISQIEVEIKDLKALKLACEQLGFDFMENQKEYRWYGKWLGKQPLPAGITEEELGKCDHAIHVPTGVFEIGVDPFNRASVIVVIAHRGIETHFFKYFLSLQCCFCLLAISGIHIDDGSMPASF